MSSGHEWPIGLLLDEVWLRARRAVVNSLADVGLWPDAAEQLTFTTAKRLRGKELRDRVLLPALREEDRRWIVSPAIFGASNRRFRAKTPSALAFGLDISKGMQMIAGRPVRQDVAEACAVFNFGISIFDLLHDTQSDLVADFTAQFDQSVLSRLNSDPDFPRRLVENSAGSDVPEFRLILQTIAAVYQRLHALDIGHFDQVAELLAAAYDAEIKSASLAAGQSIAELRQTSREKSTLPFAIISAIGDPDLGSGTQSTAHGQIVDSIGSIFWRIDDLADIVSDARSESLNSLLVEARRDEKAEIASTLTGLLEGSRIEASAQEVRDALLHVRSVVDECGDGSAKGFDRVLACYVRAWLE